MDQKQAHSSVNNLSRPPVVAILGHVDHGKTSLLDKIRSTNVTLREAGGITQSIGAWQIDTPRKITFIDTPGHTAFQSMRARGAQIADVVVLVVAADDGVMPQTKQSLDYIRESKTPFLVAITKTDLQSSDLARVKSQLLELEVILEEYGGEIVCVPVSSKTGEGIPALLEMIVLVAEMSGLLGTPKEALLAYVLETERDPRRGVVASIIVKSGTLKVGDIILAEGMSAKVRGLFNGAQKAVQEALPGDPVALIGFNQLPPVGAKIISGETVEEFIEEARAIPKLDKFAIVLKADMSGSLEAILGQLGDKVGILSTGIGDINETDIKTASAARVIVVGFNTKVSKDVLKLAEEEKVKVFNYRIIYELLQDVEKWEKEANAGPVEKILGRAKIIAQFPHGKKQIAGALVTEGRISRSDRLRLVRGEEVLGGVRMISLKRLKDEIDKATLGTECGILFEPQFDFQLGDVLESHNSS